MFVPESAKKYDMPAVFGSSPFLDRTVFGHVHMATVSFVTTRAAAEALTPSHFRVLDPAVVTISRVGYGNVDYLAGRGYQELAVGIRAAHDGEAGTTEGLWMPVLWVDDPAPIIAGRELMGYAKIGGTLPPLAQDDRSCHFRLAEYGTPLLDVTIDGLRPLTAAQLAAVGRATRPTIVLGWKLIPGAGGGVDADYPTRIVLDLAFHEGWSGSTSVAFHPCEWKDAPFSARIIDALAALPVVEARRAFVGVGSGSIDRAATARLR